MEAPSIYTVFTVGDYREVWAGIDTRGALAGMTPLQPSDPLDGTEASFPHRGFETHGRTTVWAEGAIVHVTAVGPFNREGADAFSRKIAELYRQLPPGHRFVNLTEFRTSIMATPDAWDRLAEHLQRINRMGLPLVGTAWIIGPDVEGGSLFAPRGEALFRSLDRVFVVKRTMADAEAWAREQLAH